MCSGTSKYDVERIGWLKVAMLSCIRSQEQSPEPLQERSLSASFPSLLPASLRDTSPLLLCCPKQFAVFPPFASALPKASINVQPACSVAVRLREHLLLHLCLWEKVVGGLRVSFVPPKLPRHSDSPH